MTEQVLDVTEATFERDVLERSREVPVVVDFWAAWCGPCRVLGPVLERLAADADGDWILAKVDVDSNPMLAQAAGVQGIPAVRAFKDGRQVAEFVGALPEAQVRQWLAGLGPSRADGFVDEGRAAEARDDLEAAADAYRKAVSEDPGHDEARAALARVELRLRSGSVDESALRERLRANPGDADAAVALADLEMLAGRAERSFDVLLDVVRATSGADRERARAHLVGLFEMLPSDDPRLGAARRALALALY